MLPPNPVPTRSAITRPEAFVAATLLLAMLVLRWLYRQGHPWDSDETQHLHVVWAWATGRVQYRDVFDNHSPLFHCLTAPFLAAFGERADIIEPMRFFAMTPLWAICLWAFWRIGATLHSASVGLWTALLGAVFPALAFMSRSESFFVKMGEFRTDVLWVALWVVVVAILVGGHPTVRRMFWAGLVFGACFAVSMKSVLLLITALLAALGAGLVHLLLREKAAPRTSGKAYLQMILAALAGLAIVPGLFIAWFAAHHALREMQYCVITHNAPPDPNRARQLMHQLREMRLFFLLAPLPAVAAAFALRKDPPLAVRATFLLLLAGSFYPVLHGLWQKFSSQDYLPWYPLLAIPAASLVLTFGRLIARGVRFVPAWALPATLTAGLLAYTVYTHSPLGHPNLPGIRMIDETLRLTDPNETVCDAKGETVFRPRPFYYALETLTRRALDDGRLADTLAADCIANCTTVVHRVPERMTPGSIAFIDANYTRIGLLAVLGKQLTPDADGVAAFDLVIPETYRAVSPDPTFSATLDGEPFNAPRALAAGHHELCRLTGAGAVAVIWARALERGFSPFTLHGAPKKQ